MAEFIKSRVEFFQSSGHLLADLLIVGTSEPDIHVGLIGKGGHSYTQSEFVGVAIQEYRSRVAEFRPHIYSQITDKELIA